MNDLNTVLSKLEEELKKTDPSNYPYFVRHRNRFEHDGRILKRFYKEGTILDIGCYPCHFTALLKKLDYPVIGIDLGPDRCRPFIEKFNLSIKQCDIEKESLSFPDKSIDFIVFNEVLEHLHKDPLFVFSEINRVLVRRGILLITTPNLYAGHKLLRFLRGKSFNDAWHEFSKLRRVGHMGHIREYAPSEIRKFLVMNCFRLLSLEYNHYGYFNSLRGFAGWAVHHILPPLFRTYQVVVAEKADDCPLLTSEKRYR